MILNKITVNCDLSESAFEQAMKECYASLDNKPTLFVSTALIAIAHSICAGKYAIKVDTNLNQDEWYVTTRWRGVYSPGA